jgi:hypothetical protein
METENIMKTSQTILAGIILATTAASASLTGCASDSTESELASDESLDALELGAITLTGQALPDKVDEAIETNAFGRDALNSGAIEAIQVFKVEGRTTLEQALAKAIFETRQLGSFRAHGWCMRQLPRITRSTACARAVLENTDGLESPQTFLSAQEWWVSAGDGEVEAQFVESAKTIRKFLDETAGPGHRLVSAKGDNASNVSGAQAFLVSKDEKTIVVVNWNFGA